MKKILGAILMVLPIIGVLILLAVAYGVIPMLITLAVCAAIVGCVFLGVELFMGDK